MHRASKIEYEQNQVWQHTSVIPALDKWKHKDPEVQNHLELHSKVKSRLSYKKKISSQEKTRLTGAKV